MAFDSLWHAIDIYKNKSGPKIEPWRTPQDTDAGWEKSYPKVTRKDL